MTTPRVLLLHTGGTLGMGGDPLHPGDYATEMSHRVPELGRIAQVEPRILCNLDSSDITPFHWAQIAEIIDQERPHFDGFVVIHGTDTMAYTASALAFALEGLDRPVILTGAQRPLAEIRTDARRNLVDAMELATKGICEVGICFDGLLLRGCRTTKSNAHDYRGFDSPGCPPLARLGVKVVLSPHIRHPSVPFLCHPTFDDRVVTLQLTPGFDPGIFEMLRAMERPPLGIVLIAFGIGNAPKLERAIGPALAQVHDAGVDVLVISSSNASIDFSLYENGVQLAKAGAISGGAMSVEAAVAKLMHALGTFKNRAERRRYLEWNVAGEMG